MEQEEWHVTTDYEFLVPTSCICMYKNIRVWRLWAPGGRGPVCLAHSAHPIATPLYSGEHSREETLSCVTKQG